MTEATVTEATVTDPEVTAQEGPDGTGSTTQDSTKKFEELEAQFKKAMDDLAAEAKKADAFKAQLAEIEDAKKKAEAAKEYEEKKYKGLQRETNKKDETIKRLEAQMASTASVQTQINKVEKLVAKLVERDLDPESAAKLQAEIAAEEQKAELLRLQAQVAQQQQRVAPPQLTPEYKSALYYRYFAAEFPNINPFELSLAEWHQEASSEEEWEALVRAEFEARELARTKKPEPVDTTAQFRAEFEAKLAAQREEDAKKIAEATSNLQKMQAELEETKRLAQEQLNRSKGMDRTLDTVSEPGSPSGTKKIQSELAQLNDNDLYSPDPKVRDAYSKKLNDKSLRDKLIQDMYARQSK